MKPWMRRLQESSPGRRSSGSNGKGIIAEALPLAVRQLFDSHLNLCPQFNAVAVLVHDGLQAV
jgi:hypothetical protein